MDRIAKIREFLRDKPGDGFLLHALALEYVKLNDDITAQQVWTDLLTDQPGYVGSYYHLGKLFERNGSADKAIEIYEQGMIESKKAGDQHAYNELRAAHEDLVD